MIRWPWASSVRPNAYGVSAHATGRQGWSAPRAGPCLSRQYGAFRSHPRRGPTLQRPRPLAFTYGGVERVRGARVGLVSKNFPGPYQRDVD